MRPVARWAIVPAVLAPVLLIGGWTLAAARQPAGYDPVRDTISALAGHAASDRWLMTGALAGLGLCHLGTAAGLRGAAPAGRIGYALGGAAVLAVAVFPLPVRGSSVAHTVAAAVSFGALAVWPALAGRRRGAAPVPARGRAGVMAVGLRRPVGAVAAVVLVALVGWFAVELYGLAGGGNRIGLAERFAAGAEALWPLAVVATALGSRR